MANKNWREKVRGVERETLDLLFEVITSEQWVKLLQVPLLQAAAKGNRGLARKLVGAGAEIGGALHVAVRGGHGGIVNDLLKSGAPLNGKDALCTCRATADSRDAGGKTPLHVAAIEGRPAMVELLLLKGADKDGLDVGKRTPLFMATTRGHLATAVTLLSAGADVNVRCEHGTNSALMEACRCGHVDIMRVLIEHGADVMAVTSTRSQKSVLHVAASNSTAGTIDVLVEAGANIEARDGFGGTPLHEAASKLSTKAATALLEHGADVNAQDRGESTPLHSAAAMAGQECAGRQGAADMVDLLLRSGADETIKDDNCNAAVDVIREPQRRENYPAHGGMGWFGDEYEEEEWFVDEFEDEEEDEDDEDVERVRRLLEDAPADRADRARRLRVYLVLCRAHPDRMQQVCRSTIAHVGVSRRTRSATKQARADVSRRDGSVGGGTAKERTGVDWANVLVRVVGLQEEGIFRTIVGYL